MDILGAVNRKWWVIPLACGVIAGLCTNSCPWMALIALLALLYGPITGWTLWVFGLGYMGMHHLLLLPLHAYSSLPVAIVLWALTTVYYALFYGALGMVAHRLARYSWLTPWYSLPILWPCMDALKAMGPFGNPTGAVGIILAPYTAHLPIYSVIGHLGVGMLVGIILSLTVIGTVARTQRIYCGVGIGVIGLAMLLIQSPQTSDTSPVLVTAIQTAVPQSQKLRKATWPSLESDYIREIEAAAGTIVIVPETILPTVIEKRGLFDRLKSISATQQKTLVVGSFIRDRTGLFNGSLVIHPNGLVDRYKKQRLMPFGETLPPFLMRLIPKKLAFNTFEKGDGFRDIPTSGLTLRPIICLEGLYSESYAATPGGIVTLIANMAWYGASNAGLKLRQFAQVYAAESQRMVVVSSNTGQSAIIAPTGALIAVANHAGSDQLTAPIIITNRVSLYHQWPYVGCLLIGGIWLLAARFLAAGVPQTRLNHAASTPNPVA